ncbi:TPA: hypothetical protein ACHKM1_002769, partial [Enterococcus faecium]
RHRKYRVSDFSTTSKNYCFFPLKCLQKVGSGRIYWQNQGEGSLNKEKNHRKYKVITYKTSFL